MKKLLGAVSAVVILFSAGQAMADCDDGEIVIKFSHVTADSGHPKGDAARAIADRINSEMNGKACMEVYPSSTLFDDDKVMEALLLGDVQVAAPSLSKFEAYTQEIPPVRPAVPVFVRRCGKHLHAGTGRPGIARRHRGQGLYWPRLQL